MQEPEYSDKVERGKQELLQLFWEFEPKVRADVSPYAAGAGLSFSAGETSQEGALTVRSRLFFDGTVAGGATRATLDLDLNLRT
jgi:hypothetical protein